MQKTTEWRVAYRCADEEPATIDVRATDIEGAIQAAFAALGKSNCEILVAKPAQPLTPG